MESGKDGRKQYANHSTMQAALNQGAVPYLRLAGQTAGESTEKEVRVADFGCSVGNNSAKELQVLVDSIRSAKNGENKIVSVYSVDVPNNDWSMLFRNVAAGYGSSENVHCFAVGGSFYEKRFPDGFLDVGYAAICLHWLSTPVQTADNIIPQRDAATAKVAAGVAADDWLRFLRLWRQQSRAGALLVATHPSPFQHSQHGGWWEALDSAWHSLASDGLISGVEERALQVPIYHRSSAELLQPLKEDPEISNALEVVALEDCSVLDPTWRALSGKGDLDGLARGVAGMARTALSNSIRKALQQQSRTEEVVDEWERRTAANIRRLLDTASAEDVCILPCNVIAVQNRAGPV